MHFCHPCSIYISTFTSVLPSAVLSPPDLSNLQVSLRLEIQGPNQTTAAEAKPRFYYSILKRLFSISLPLQCLRFPPWETPSQAEGIYISSVVVQLVGVYKMTDELDFAHMLYSDLKLKHRLSTFIYMQATATSKKGVLFQNIYDPQFQTNVNRDLVALLRMKYVL